MTQRDDLAAALGRDQWRVVDADTMRALDRHTIQKLEVSAELLMESAGRAVAEAALRLDRSGPVWVLCGPGNNGGDGFVVARHLFQLGVAVEIVFLGHSERLSSEAQANWARTKSLGITVRGPSTRWTRAGVVIDALFGTGLGRPLRGDAAVWVRRARSARSRGARVISIDVPSGLDADTGQVLGTAVEADLTVTLGLPKLGLALEPGRSHAGEIVVARIGIADVAPDAGFSVELWRPGRAARELPARLPGGHKGSFGHVLVVAGSPGKTGAAALAAAGAGRAGAGLVTVACPSSLNAILEVKCTEAMTAPLPETPDQTLGPTATTAVLELAAERDVVAMGPGLGRGAATGTFLLQVAESLAKPLVLDADGLYPFAGALEQLRARRAPTVLTPHPGEAGRLLGSSAQAVNADRVAAACTLAERTGSTVVLKGAATVVASAEGFAAINPTGGPELGSGGTGDVLTGIVAALLAQGLGADRAATLAAWVHGATGDALAHRSGLSGVLAGDVAQALPATFEALRRGARGEAFPRFARRRPGGPLGLPFP